MNIYRYFKVHNNKGILKPNWELDLNLNLNYNLNDFSKIDYSNINNLNNGEFYPQNIVISVIKI